MVSISRAAWVSWPAALLLACSAPDQLIAPTSADAPQEVRSGEVAATERAAVNEANRQAFLSAATRTLKGGRYARAVVTRDAFGARRVRSLAEVVKEHEGGSFGTHADAGGARSIAAPPPGASKYASGVDGAGNRLITRAASVVIGGTYASAAAVAAWVEVTVYAAENTMTISSNHPSLTLKDTWNNILQSGRGRDPKRISEMFSEWQLFNIPECDALHATTSHTVTSSYYGHDEAGSMADWNPDCEQRREPVSPGGGGGGGHSIDAIGIPETQTDSWHCWLNQERWFEGGVWSQWVTTDMECGY